MELLIHLNDFDRQLFSKVFKQREGSAVIPLARAFSRSSDGWTYVLTPLVAWVLQVPNLESLILLLLLSFGLERTLHPFLKNSLKRPRPKMAIPGLKCLIVASDKFSFPSGHSSRAFLLATVLVVVYGVPAFAMVFWAGGVALSRVLLGVHYPGDVLAGAGLGSAIALLSATVIGVI
jgi:undecaprenyl-diphosphatase